jgi:hypothetical protein
MSYASRKEGGSICGPHISLELSVVLDYGMNSSLCLNSVVRLFKMVALSRGRLPVTFFVALAGKWHTVTTMGGHS